MVTAEQHLHTGLRTDQRMALFGRLRMAEWIEMSEPEFSAEIAKLEKDPLFRKLCAGAGPGQNAVRRQRWPKGELSSGFYEFNEGVLAGGERVRVEEILGEKALLLPKIRKMGRAAFEKYFLYGEEPVTLEEIATRTGLSLADVQGINEILLEIGSEAEFSRPGREPGVRAYACLARLNVEPGEEAPSFEFFSPYWARGLYHIRYDLIERWKDGTVFDGAELRRLPHLLKRMETINLRQNTVFRILEALTGLQTGYLKSQKEDLKRPISLRQLAHRLDLAPSTVSRALSGRSVLLPWGKEVPLIMLLPGRRRVLRQVLGQWLEADGSQTDARLAVRLNEEYGIKVSRRTVNAVRNELGKSKRT